MIKVQIKVSQSREHMHTWVHLHSFLTSPLDWVNGQLKAPAALRPGGALPFHLTGSLVGLRAGLEVVEQK